MQWEWITEWLCKWIVWFHSISISSNKVIQQNNQINPFKSEMDNEQEQNTCSFKHQLTQLQNLVQSQFTKQLINSTLVFECRFHWKRKKRMMVTYWPKFWISPKCLHFQPSTRVLKPICLELVLVYLYPKITLFIESEMLPIYEKG